MEFVPSLLTLLVGLAIGFACAWFINRSKTSSVLGTARASVEGEQARLRAQLEASERRAAELGDQLTSKDARVTQLQSELTAEIGCRSKAEAVASRIPEFERMVADLVSRVDEANDRITAAASREAVLVTERDKERLAAAEKLALIDDAQRKLADTFTAFPPRPSSATTSPSSASPGRSSKASRNSRARI